MWNRAGTVTVTNGSAVVTGNGTNFSFPNAQPGQAFIGPNGLPIEILSVDSATQLTLAVPYTGATANGQPFAILPTASFANDLALAFSGFKNLYGAMLDAIGQGIFQPGTEGAPGVRGVNDQDTGLIWPGGNVLGMIAGGVRRFSADGDGAFVSGRRLAINGSTISTVIHATGVANWSSGIPEGANRWAVTENQFGVEMLTIANSGNVGIGTVAPRAKVESFRNVAGVSNLILSSSFAPTSYVELNAGVNGVSNGGFDIRLGGVSRAVIDDTGNFLVGVSSASNHVIARGTVEGDLIMQVQGKAHPGVAFFSAASGSANGSACTFALNKNSQTGRSINAAGTINGSGADYAEYMLKAAGCGIIAKGGVCGVDREGRLTKTWADAISFVVKSTDPSLVGGDTWASHLPPRPEQEESETDEAFAAREAEWSAELEQARLCVDRIAFCGQVPCNVTGDFEVGDYIVAAANGAGIKAVAMKLDDMTLAQYARRIGKVWAIRDGRAWIDVQHG